MEPNNHNHAGNPFDNYNYDPAQLQRPRSLAGQAMPPPPLNPHQFQLFQPQGGDVFVGENPASAGILRNGNIQGYDLHMPGLRRTHFSPAPQRPSMPIFINNQYQASGSGPRAQHGSAALVSAHGGGGVVGRAAPYQWLLPSHWQSEPNSSGSQCHPSTYCPQPGAGARTDFSAWGDNDSLDQYTPTRLAAPLAYQGQADYYQLPRNRAPAIQEVRDHLLNSHPNPSLVTNPETSKQAVFLLDHGDHEVRRKVLISVLCDVHTVMGSDAGAEVFVALLRAAERAEQLAELSGIVRAAASPNVRFFLMKVAGQ